MVNFEVVRDEIIESDNYEEETDEGLDDTEDLFEDVIDTGESQNEDANLIDAVVGYLEELLIDPSFEAARLEFCRENCDVFEETEENKLVYTELHGKFSSMVEEFLEEKLKAEFPQFSVAWFVDLLSQQEKEDPFEGDVFEMLFNLTDFSEFKEMMCAFKKEKERETTGEGDAFDPFEVTRMRIRKEEQEDGEERPDLDMSCMQVRPIAQTQ